jgi:hypothetical protein
VILFFTELKSMGAPKGHEAYNTEGEGGRPQKYTPEFIEGEADAFEEWLQQPNNLFFKRFAFSRGYHPNRLTEFAEKSKRFSGVYQMARAWQEIRLVEGGLLSEFNAGFCKFVLGNICDWVENRELRDPEFDAEKARAEILKKILDNRPKIGEQKQRCDDGSCD